uniref:Uncharacterized protein n=1 Tax=Arundo donax TaxID=35708 RepID=A0A0A9SSJ4_ARUDO
MAVLIAPGTRPVARPAFKNLE